MYHDITKERQQIRMLINHVCLSSPLWQQLDYARRDMLTRRMERNCFEVVIDNCIRDGTSRLFTNPVFVNRYSAICSRLISNLDIKGPVGSDFLLKNIINGTIDVYNVANLTSFELCPEASHEERSIIELRRRQKADNKVSRAYVCKKCGGNETIPIEYQGRSVDEGSSRSIKCVNCEYVWRFS